MKQKQILLKNLGFKLEHHFNEKFININIFFKSKPTFAENNIVYLDVQYIMISELGIFYKYNYTDDIKSTLLKEQLLKIKKIQ